jgi:hypothetical protein
MKLKLPDGNGMRWFYVATGLNNSNDGRPNNSFNLTLVS